MDDRQILAQLLMQGQGQGMGGANDVSDYLGQRSVEDLTPWLAHKAAAAPWMMAGTAAGATGNMPLALASMLPMLYHGYQSQQARNRNIQNSDGSDMWANRFGSGQPAQGMPGLPSGPTWRR